MPLPSLIAVHGRFYWPRGTPSHSTYHQDTEKNWDNCEFKETQNEPGNSFQILPTIRLCSQAICQIEPVEVMICLVHWCLKQMNLLTNHSVIIITAPLLVPRRCIITFLFWYTLLQLEPLKRPQHWSRYVLVKWGTLGWKSVVPWQQLPCVSDSLTSELSLYPPPVFLDGE